MAPVDSPVLRFWSNLFKIFAFGATGNRQREPWTNFNFLVTFILLSANAFNLEQYEVLLLGKELKLHGNHTYTIPNFQHNTKLPWIFKVKKLFVRLNQNIVLFLFLAFDSSPKQSRLFMPLRKKSLKEQQRKSRKCWLLVFSPYTHIVCFQMKMRTILPVFIKEKSLKQGGNRRKSW